MAKLNREKLDALLRSLADDREEAGRKYEILREKLITMFHCRGRGLGATANELSDETLDRLGAKCLDGRERSYTELSNYALGIGRYVAKERFRQRRKREEVSVDEPAAKGKDISYSPLLWTPAPADPRAASNAGKPPGQTGEGWDGTKISDDPQRMKYCAERCLKRIPAEKRRLLLAWYMPDGPEREAILKEYRLQDITPNALRKRVFDTRKKVQSCALTCRDKGQGPFFISQAPSGTHGERE